MFFEEALTFFLIREKIWTFLPRHFLDLKKNQQLTWICIQGKLPKVLNLHVFWVLCGQSLEQAENLHFILQFLPCYVSLKSCSSGTISAIALTKVSLEAHRKNVEGEISRKDCWTQMGPGAKRNTSVLVPIWNGSNIWTVFYTIHYTLYTIHYILYVKITHYTLYIIHYTLYTTLYT